MLLRLLLTASAFALVLAPTALAREVRPPLLSELPGDAACVMIRGGTIMPPCNEAPGLASPRAVVTSPRGRDVYVSVPKRDRILHLRASAAGALVYSSCVGTGAHGCRSAGALRGVTEMAFSADGRWLLALAPRSGAVALFERDARGRLHERDCLASRRSRSRATTGCRRARALAGAGSVAVSSDGRTAYVGVGRRRALVGLRRDGRRLTPLPGASGCAIDRAARVPAVLRRCRRVDHLGAPVSVAVAPDGRNVYTASTSPAVVSILRRRRRSGALTAESCITPTGAGRCTSATAVRGPVDVVVSPDDANVYVVATEDRTLTAFSRDVSGRLDQIGCYGSGLRIVRSCGFVPVFVAPRQLALAPSGEAAYVVDSSSSTVTVFDRAFGGDLAPEGPPQGCVSPFAGCSPGRGLLAASAIAVAPTSRTVYALSPLESSIAVLQRIPVG